jgi:Gpi18-like mannosyltransferase
MQTIVARLKHRITVRENQIFVALLAVAILVRIPLMTFHGYYFDLSTYISWGETVNQHFTQIYTAAVASANQGNGGFGRGGFAFGIGDQGINYPPGMPYVFGAVVYSYNLVLAPSLHSSLGTLALNDGIGPFIAKIPLLLADVAMIIYLYMQTIRRHSARFALLATASYAFSPALLYNGAIWGQTDGFVSFPLLVGIFALVGESYVLGGASLALAILLKPQPIIFVPLILLYLWRWTNRQKFWTFTVASLVTLLVFSLPIIVPHFQIFTMLQNMQAQSYNAGSSLSSNAFNFWWLIGYQQQSIGTAIFGAITAGVLGDLLFGAVTVIVCAQIWRHREPIYLFLGMVIQIFGFFMFMGGQHERYLFMFIPLALASIVVAQRNASHHLINLYIAGTALCFLNMVVGVSSFSSSQVIPFVDLPSLSTFLSAGFSSLGLLIAFLHLGVFIYALRVFLAQQFEPLKQPEGQMVETSTLRPAAMKSAGAGPSGDADWAATEPA